MHDAPKGTRARGRELALLALCHVESYPSEQRELAVPLLWENPPRGDDSGLEELVGDGAARAFAEQLLGKVITRWHELDQLIEATSRTWRLSRMDRVDRNVLRLAAAELAHDEQTPRAVVLAEAVRLASRYGSERSAPFVNGLVEALAIELRAPRGEVQKGTEPDENSEPNVGTDGTPTSGRAS